MSLPEESWDVLGDMGPFKTNESALEEIEEFRADSRSLLLAAVDKQREAVGTSSFAGVYGLIEHNVDQGVRMEPFLATQGSALTIRIFCLVALTYIQDITAHISIPKP
jgi:hypothetical protein